MLRNQKDIFKAKKLVQKLLSPGKTTPLPPKRKLCLPPVPLETPLSDPCPLPPEPLFYATPGSPRTLGLGLPDPKPALSKLETRNSKLLAHFFFGTGNQEPQTDTDPGLLETENRKPETENQLFNVPKPPPPCDETSRRADELFEISHGYKRNNPPPIIPNRRLEEDFRSRSIFGDVKNVLKYM